jgi:RND family efflux transporter MFP subunit
LQVPAYPNDTFTGTVSAIAPAVDQKSRTASVLIDPKDDAGKLRPGMLAQVNIVTGAQPNALLVPREAVLGSATPNGQATVVTLDGGKAQRTTVHLGLIGDQFVEITSGLADGQVVAVGNANGLNSGDAVVPQLRTALVPVGVQ